MKVLCRFYWDCGRQGDLDGLFTTTTEEVSKVVGKEVYFGEVLGKHSEVFGTIGPDDIEVLSKDQDFINKFEDIMGSGTISGYNPLDYYEEEDDE